MIRITGRFLISGLVVLAAGCATPVAAPEDPSFGAAVAAAKARHLVNPQPAQPRWNGAGMDGTAAYESIQRYQDTFRAPPPTFVIINAAPGGGAK